MQVTLPPPELITSETITSLVSYPRPETNEDSLETMSGCCLDDRSQLKHSLPLGSGSGETPSYKRMRLGSPVSLESMTGITDYTEDSKKLLFYATADVISASICTHIPISDLESEPEDADLQITDLPDELWFRVYSFMHTKSHCESLTINELCQTMSYVSKDENDRLVRYLRHVPQDFSYMYDEGIENIDALLWASQKRIKLGKVDFRSCDSCAEFNLCLHMLRTCNITDLEILKIKTFVLANDDLKKKCIVEKVAEAGISVDEIEKPMNPINFQREIAICIKENTRALRKICFESKYDEIHVPFLTNSTRTLKDITLKLFEGTGDTESCLRTMTDAVNKMPKLKKLKINACMKGSISVKSFSVKKIDVRSSVGGFFIDECVCPNLQTLRSSYFVEDQSWSGVRPVARISTQQKLANKFLEEKRIVDIQVRSNPFLGMYAPDECTVRIYLQKQNYI